VSIRLYGWPRSSATRVRWALEELGVPYELVVLDGAKGEHRAPEYLAISPSGKVPGMLDGEQRYFESLAMILHLGETCGRDRKLWPSPSDASLRAEALCWSVWGTVELHGYMMQYLYHGLDTRVSYAPEQRSKATADYNHGQFRRALDALERQLTGRDFVLGDFSLADIPSAWALLFGTSLGVSLEGRANVARWVAACRARPALARLGEV
jgi:glutathione S-transferase